MANFKITSFKFGLDRRRSLLTSQPGVLTTCQDAHINEGAEIEKRKAMIRMAIPAGTFGLQETSTCLVVFGSISTPAGLAVWPASNTTWGVNVPALSYMRLTPPATLGAGLAMTALIFSTVYKGLPFCLAKFNDTNKTVLAFYNGALVQDFLAGQVGEVQVGASFAADQATAFAAIVEAGFAAGDLNYRATATGATVTLTGINGNSYGVAFAKNSALGTITASQTNIATLGANAIAPVGSFVIAAGQIGTGTPPNIKSVLINQAIQLLSAVVNWAGDTTSTAIAVAANINGYTGTSGYSALATGNTVQIFGPPGTGANSYSVAVYTATSSNNDGSIVCGNCVYVFTAPVSSTLTVTKLVAGGNPWTINDYGGSPLNLNSFANLNAFLTQLAADTLAYQLIHGPTFGGVVGFTAAAMGNNLYVSVNSDGDPSVSQGPTTVVLTYTAGSGATVTGASSLTASASTTLLTVKPATASPPVTVTAANGTPPYQYVWTVSAYGIGILSPNAATTQFTSISTVHGVATCTVVDSGGQTTTVAVQLIFKP